MRSLTRLSEAEWHKKELTEDQVNELAIIIGGLESKYDLELMAELIQRRLKALCEHENMGE